MELKRLRQDFTVCKISDITQVDFSAEFLFLSKTDDELSLVCETPFMPPNVLAVENGWKALKIAGILDFNLVGIIAEISCLLADGGISLFVISTYNTDYILLKKAVIEEGIRILKEHGFSIAGE